MTHRRSTVPVVFGCVIFHVPVYPFRVDVCISRLVNIVLGVCRVWLTVLVFVLRSVCYTSLTVRLFAAAYLLLLVLLPGSCRPQVPVLSSTQTP